MRPPRAEREPGPVRPASGEFFIPDLCATRSVFMLVLLSELMVVVFILANSSLPRFDWSLLAGSSLLVQWVVLVSALALCWLRGPFNRLKLQTAAASSLLVILLVTALSSLAAMAYIPWLAGAGEGGWWLLRNLLVALVLGGIVLRYFFLQQQLRVREQLELQARLDSLRARIRPHFLFNTLNSIASLIASRPQAAERAVEDLSELFRASLKESHEDMTVADEIHLCELYLGIEQLRLGERLEVVWDVEDSQRDAPMPSLVLQPLVENAVYHGISRLPDGGRIEIAVRAEDEVIRVTVENPVPHDSGMSEGEGMALNNVAQRLQATFGPGARLQTTPVPGRFRVDLAYPPGARR